MGKIIDGTNAVTGKVDPKKTRIARIVNGGSRKREAGMMLEGAYSFQTPYYSGYKMDSYRTSYAFGLGQPSGNYDVPKYFVTMNEQNGGMLYWPVTLQEKYSWYRYWCYFLDDKHLARVLLADGTLKSIKDIEVGEEVITGTGTIRRVSEKIERQCKDPKAVEIDVWGLQNSTLVTHEHPFYILRKDKVKKDKTHYRDNIDFFPEWVNADRVEVGDYVLMAPYKPEKLSDISVGQAAFLGYYASEGSIVWGLRCLGTDNGAEEQSCGGKWHQDKVKVPLGVVFTLHKDEEMTVGKRILELSLSVFGVEGRIIRRRENHIELLVSGRNVGEFCHLHVGTGSDKKLSKDLLDATVEAKKSFLLAYAEGDGHLCAEDKNKGKILIPTASESLASQVQVMAISSGVMCRIAKYERNDKWSDSPIWHVIISSWSADSIMTGSSEWGECAFFINGYAAFKVEKVVYCEREGTVYNLELEAHGEEKSFQCNGMVSHNCRTDPYIGRGLDLLTDLPMSKLTLNMPKMKDDQRALRDEIMDFFKWQVDKLGLFELCQAILSETLMLGNCFPADHLVQTPDGMIPICQVRKGDSVLGATGWYERVSAISRRRVSEWLIDFDIARLSAMDFTPTSEHPIVVLRNGVEVMLPAKDVRVGDFIGIASLDVENDVAVKSISSENDATCEQVAEKPFKSHILNLDIDKDFLYLLGYWLGDGWLWRYKRPQSYSYLAFDICVEPDAPQIGRLNEVMSSVFGDNFDYGCSPIWGNDENMRHFLVEDPIFCAWWGHQFGFDCKSKKLPSWIMELPPEKQIWILRGMIDSDGFVSSNESGAIMAGICNANITLMHQLFQIGIRSGIPFCFGKTTSRDIVFPQGYKKESAECFYLKIGEYLPLRKLVEGCVKELVVPDGGGTINPNYIEENGKFYFRVNNVGRKFHDGFVYNLEVEGSHTYCANQVRTHNCFVFHEFDEEKKMWSRAVMLPPEEVFVFQYPFSEHKRIEYKPMRLMQIIKSAILQDGTNEPPELQGQDDKIRSEIVKSIPEDIVAMVRENDAIVMDTDPNEGSFVAHIARRKAPYMDLGSSILERVLVPMLEKEHLRYTQLSLSSRLMTPRQVITAAGLLPSELEDLRAQVDLSYLDPDYAIVANYEINIQEMSSRDRLLDLSSEYERIDNQVFAALGVTREIMTGESQYSGAKITTDILNTMFLISRDIIKSYIEKQLFIPICEKRGWFEECKNGVKKYWYPKVGFNRLTIRDNAEVFDSLFQLYQKGSLPVDVIYELFNLDEEEMSERLRNDVFSVRDATFNRMLEEVNSDVGRAIVEKTDIVRRVAGYLGLKVKKEDGSGGGMGDLGLGGEQAPAETLYEDPGFPYGKPPLARDENDELTKFNGRGNSGVPSVKLNLDEVAQKVADRLRPGASADEIRKVVDGFESQKEG